ncbi:hypothetical protein [Persephonella sp.]|uniref:hypothetical protein n=1 Tax=Persephonella sp. TaxID=2060922 RepID=UPI0025E43000|nr:hypothetical protein [Persephonella sp.]
MRISGPKDSNKELIRLEKRLNYRFEDNFIRDALVSFKPYRIYHSAVEECKRDFLCKASDLSGCVDISISSDKVEILGDVVFDLEIDRKRIFLTDYAKALSDVLEAYSCAEEYYSGEELSGFKIFSYVKYKNIEKLRELFDIGDKLNEEYLDSLFSRMVKRHISVDTVEYIDEIKDATLIYLRYTASRLDGFYNSSELSSYVVCRFRGSIWDFIQRYCPLP